MRVHFLLLVAVVVSSQAPPAVRTMRLDYFHTGNTRQELFSLDEAVVEPSAWPGHAGRAADALGYGAYGFDVRDAATKRLRYSHGFGSIYDEWVTTEEARTATRTFPSPGALIEFEKHGDPATKVDILLLGDGYTAAERAKFETDSRKLLDVLFATSPFKERRNAPDRMHLPGGTSCREESLVGM